MAVGSRIAGGMNARVNAAAAMTAGVWSSPRPP